MEKVKKCIEMLQMLNTGRLYKVSELAQELGMSVRNVIEYKKTLFECGYPIISVPGRYGGYCLDRNVVIPSLKLLPSEKEAIIESYTYLMSKKDFPKKEAFRTALGKIASSIEIQSFGEETLSVDRYQLTMPEKDIAERYRVLEEAIATHHAVELHYNSLKNGATVHTIHPYTMVNYNNSWFVLALNPEAQQVWPFKVNRIGSIKRLDKRFTVLSGYKAEDYFDEHGFRYNGTIIHVVLLARGMRRRLVQERVFGKNQVVTPVDEEAVRVEMDVQDDGQTFSTLFGWASNIEVLEPPSLREKFKETLQQMRSLYSEGDAQ